MKKLIHAGLFFIALLLLVNEGCVPSKPTDDIEILPAERLINKLEANRRRIRTFQGTGTINVKSNEFDNSASFRVVVSKPDSIGLTVMGPFGIELANILVTNQEFFFYDALQNTVYRGEVSNDILREIFKIDLSFNDLMDAFIGSVNLTENLYTTPSGYEVDEDQYVLTYTDSLSNVSTEYRVDIRELGIKDYRLINSDGTVLLQGNYSKFDILESVAVPYVIKVQNINQDQTINIEYRNMSANKRNIFIDYKIPNDADVIKW